LNNFNLARARRHCLRTC